MKSVEYRPQRVQTLLRPQIEGGGWFWSLDPYEGCELGCAFCPVTLEQQGAPRVGVRVNAEVALRQVLRMQDLEGRPVVLGNRTDPWQPAEERFRITRSVLATLADEEGVEVRATTRSWLVARDADLLRAIGDQGKVAVTVSLASLDDSLNALLEPKAPSAAERLAAVERLANAGVRVGVLLSPMLPGLTPEELGLEALMSRAAAAGASYAGLQFLGFNAGGRERFLSRASPELMERLSLLPDTYPEARHREVMDAFEALRGRLGLRPYGEVMALRPWPSRPPAVDPGLLPDVEWELRPREPRFAPASGLPGVR